MDAKRTPNGREMAMALLVLHFCLLPCFEEKMYQPHLLPLKILAALNLKKNCSHLVNACSPEHRESKGANHVLTEKLLPSLPPDPLLSSEADTWRNWTRLKTAREWHASRLCLSEPRSLGELHAKTWNNAKVEVQHILLKSLIWYTLRHKQVKLRSTKTSRGKKAFSKIGFELVLDYF